MKKLLVIGCVLALTACGHTAETSNSDLSSCLTQKAYAALADGTLANSEVMPLAKKIAGQCIQQLALAGMDTEAINASKTLLTVLKENTVATTK